jgi:hypothetical protein
MSEWVTLKMKLVNCYVINNEVKLNTIHAIIAFACRDMFQDNALSIYSANSWTRVCAFISDASKFVITIAIVFTFPSTTFVRITKEAIFTETGSS